MKNYQGVNSVDKSKNSGSWLQKMILQMNVITLEILVENIMDMYKLVGILISITNKRKKYNHQCELVVFSAAESLYCRPRPERPPEVLNFCTTFTY